MVYTVREKAKLIGCVRPFDVSGDRSRRSSAQKEECGCIAVIPQIAGVCGTINGLLAEVLEDLIRVHNFASDPAAAGSEDLTELVPTYPK
jgi:FrmR/RcnR family transcriptional regulator, repressor of frmRAB operon